MKLYISALLASVLFVGCANDNTQTLAILQNAVPQVSGTVCMAPAGATTTFRSSGVLDIAFFGEYGGSTQPSAGYLMFLAVQNKLTGSVLGTTVGTTEMYTVTLKRVDVQLLDGYTNRPLADRFSVPIYKLLGANETAGIAVDIMPASVIASLADGMMVMAKLRVVGTRDGSEIRSNTMEYAIAVCDGCLLYDTGPCTEFSGTATVNACNIAQDEPAVCCEHSTRGLLCPAQTEEVTTGEGGT